MQVDTLIVGELRVNCYIISHEDSRECIIIDPGENGERILQFLEEKGLTPIYIINTHGHSDHIGANLFIAEQTGAKILIHQNDAKMLHDPISNLSSFLSNPAVSKQADYILEDGEILEISGITIEVVHTPGHTKGGICLKIDNYLFTGDTLFAGGVGRTDFPSGSHKTLMESIGKRLMTLSDEITIYPGHGESSTIGMERRNNPFLNTAMRN
ncbi:MBL fold metallo-hydrolase [Candidatus Desantisbacteria bacterium CG2_30_40_21]|uniref:MBL fold metallo-hydrolase n=5 Tax=unclassified Candidatus Desantisiibacteriota TaxID=3106372 RepID=A0A2M7JEI1_9BACT|nr:MAG: MBL fold metallo-hydrolase [Candidatus Desantisbacteria bacterium CG2_30_40_21]PIP41833.1 MAG: MBL fold metallo-hydrolase [Candidatus Desantisbacteria bacterium CG23_combo_of_CG06-09_8_20_14_all_40_23]PIX17807.1 MAG: MBL fold metallo-hydrolase [Candidatus Desantisbacteria bacterium CG_4_8_14_3_um_filter_40_12]PIY20134.1 MAG: MBL fold metallo-hydrolase [Candidatus Desantisbacteria bacterium CG_4_10_14_3_um_filter_40_18]PJB29738.1 MAG: MBL fold metallo-hydrolase [Candidatus Desantisbacter